VGNDMWLNKVLIYLDKIFNCLRAGTLLGIGFMIGVSVVIILMLSAWVFFSLYLFS